MSNQHPPNDQLKVTGFSCSTSVIMTRHPTLSNFRMKLYELNDKMYIPLCACNMNMIVLR